MKRTDRSPQPLERAQPAFFPVQTPDGVFLARYSDQGLCELRFPGSQESLQSASPASDVVRTWHNLTTKALSSALAGERASALPPLDLTGGTPFQQSVWRAMLQIACGHTRSYAQLAHAIGSPKALRAVGQACGANPIPVLVPCHRVVAAHQRLGGFSSGLHWKRLLLEREARFSGGDFCLRSIGT